jgi:hypothetical protein
VRALERLARDTGAGWLRSRHGAGIERPSDHEHCGQMSTGCAASPARMQARQARRIWFMIPPDRAGRGRCCPQVRPRPVPGVRSVGFHPITEAARGPPPIAPEHAPPLADPRGAGEHDGHRGRADRAVGVARGLRVCNGRYDCLAPWVLPGGPLRIQRIIRILYAGWHVSAAAHVLRAHRPGPRGISGHW